MAPFITPDSNNAPVPPHQALLAGAPDQWPEGAQDAYRLVLSELDSWCRDHNASHRFNSWVAGEAVRRSW